MRALKLDISRLPTAENKLIRAYFRLYAHEPDFLWEIAEAPPFNAIIIDGDNPESGGIATDGVQQIVLGGDGDLSRPLRSDTLIAHLRALQSPAPTPELPVMAPAPARKMAAIQPPVDAQPAPIALPREYFRLTAEPPAALLQRNPQRQQAASLLLRQALSLQDIAQATRWQIGEVQTFIGLLRNTGLLEISDEPASAPKKTPTDVSTAEADSALSLGGALSSFRKKLGF